MLNRNKNNEFCKPNLTLFKALALLFLFFFSFFSPPSQASPKIAICQIVEHPALNVNLQGILDALKEQGYSTDSGAEIIFENAQGNALLLSQISQHLVSMDADVYVALGTQAAQSMMSALRSSKKPLVFSAITDPKDAKLVNNYQRPEGFVTGVSDAADLEPQFKLFQELVPHLKRLGVVYNPGELNSITSLKRMKTVGAKLGIEIVKVSASKTSEVIGAAQSLIGKVDAYFVDNDNTALSSFEGIVKIGLENQTPVFVSDTDMVERGALAAMGPNQYKLGQEAGKMVAQLIAGELPSQIPVYFPTQLERVTNHKVANELGIQLE